jgi:carboxylesterase
LGNAFANINQTLWELHKKVKQQPGNLRLRKELLRLFFESAQYMERRNHVPEEDRSFLLLQERESLCCMLIHGGGGSPREMRPLGDHLYEHGYTVYGIRLPLHGPQGSTSRPSGRRFSPRASFPWKKRIQNGLPLSWSTCLSASEIALETIMEYTPNTYVFGFSFGGTIVLNLIQRYEVKGAVLISPAIVPLTTTRSLLFRALRKIIRPAARRIAPMEDTMLDLMEQTRSAFQTVQQPLLVIQAENDPIVSIKGFELLRGKAANPRSRFVRLKQGGHILVGSDAAGDVFSMCSDFIKQA